MWKRFHYVSFIIFIILSIVLSACGNENSEENSKQTNDSSKVDLGKKDITITYVSWESAVASNHVIQHVLENLGYNVELIQTQAGAQYAGVADGTADALIDSWLPTTSKYYYDRYKDQLVDLGTSLEGAPQGLVVPKYMEIDSVKELAENKNNVGKKTNWTITGIDAGSGEMQIIRKKMMPAYGLDNKWTLEPSSSAAMLAALESAINDHEEIVVTLWKPHWAFSEWDLKMLKDPKDVFKQPDSIHTLVRKGFKDDFPAATKVLKQFHWTKKDLGKVMALIHKGMEPKDAAKKWVKNNQDLVNKWTKGVK